MCCNYKKPVVEALAAFRDATGLNIGQKEWHRLRNAAEARLKAEGKLAPDAWLTNARADAELVVATAVAFARSIGQDDLDARTFAQRLGDLGMSQGNVETLHEVTLRIGRGEPVGVKARQSRDSKTVTAMDLLARIGAFEDIDGAFATVKDPTPGARSTATPTQVFTRRLRTDVRKYDTTDRYTLPSADPDTPAAGIREAITDTYTDLGAHNGYVSTTGVVFVLGDAMAHGLGVSLNADGTDTVTITAVRWRTPSLGDVLTYREQVPVGECAAFLKALAAHPHT